MSTPEMSTPPPRLECDLVMKGGVTSGIVYPPLVLKLKEHGYQFRCVGGTSAGAIAAAATAAAEFGREHDGFKKLGEMKDELSATNFLRNLFQPATATAPLMNFLLDYVKSSKQIKGEGFLRKLRLIFKVTWAAARRTPIAFMEGALLGVAIVCLFAFAVTVVCLSAFNIETAADLVIPRLTSDNAFMYLVVLVALLSAAWIGGMTMAMRRFTRILIREVPRNKFGMCTGRKDPDSPARAEVLTDWLHTRINDMAGLAAEGTLRPLTFGDLRSKPFPANASPKDPAEENIMLRMVTSNLSQNQPYVLPFKQHLFLFKEAEFRELFPNDVIDYLVAEDTPKPLGYTPPPGFHFLPEADALPVIVATRMSLSFPVLLSAIPLYTIKPDYLLKVKRTGAGQTAPTLAESDLRVNWFSDGGICSNFPMHFFDSWLPTRPTFGINLTSLPDEAIQTQGEPQSAATERGVAQPAAVHETVNPDYLSPTSVGVSSAPTTAAVYLPKADECPVTELIPLDSRAGQPDLMKFIWAIFTTAQNYRDNAQSVLPSYRERIVQVRLSDDEGGLNLAMPVSTIEKVVGKGERAGELLTGFEFDKHQWVRFRVLMQKMEESLSKMNTTMRENTIYSGLLSANVNLADYPYNYVNPQQMQTAIARLIQIGDAIQAWNNVKVFAGDPPLVPEPVLRVTPEL